MAGGAARATGQVVLLRHGETEWSRTGRHTGLTDVPLTAAGETRAAQAGALLPARVALCLASPLQRAWRTAELAGLDAAPDRALEERHYGNVEGLSTRRVRELTGDPGWDVWDDRLQGTPDVEPPPDAYRGPGESLEQVAARVDPIVSRCRDVTREGGDVVLVAHSHLLRVLAARWLGLPPAAGRHLVLDAGRVAVLGYERSTPALLGWNLGSR